MDRGNLEKVTLQESVAFNQITLDLLEQKKKEHFRLWLIIIALIIVNLVEVGIFVWYESQWDLQKTVVTETMNVEQDAGEGNGNNIYQSGENAQYNESGG